MTDGRVRLFVDRAFTVRGAGTVVTGTLGAGTLHADDRLTLAPAGTEVRVRGLQALGETRTEVGAVARVAVNLRGLAVEQVRRGDVLLTPGGWALTREADVRLASIDPADLPGDLVLHLGSAAVPARLRPLGDDVARLRLASPLPLQPGDAAVLREPSSRLATGLTVLDVDPPPLRRRGAAQGPGPGPRPTPAGRPDPVAEVLRRGSETRARLAALGVLPLAAPVPAGAARGRRPAGRPGALQRLARGAAARAVDAATARSPLEPGLSAEDAARQLLGLPDARPARRGRGRHRRRAGAPGGAGAAPRQRPGVRPAVAAALQACGPASTRDPLDAPRRRSSPRPGSPPGSSPPPTPPGCCGGCTASVLVHPG